ncbi:kinetochore protein NUF2 [Thraustotheca clavata]|uniref:Kinetochore protein NUF2 n=1 Tax=Thraustotheca clavata TaxID=74557 RepID=A0A1V9ZMB2_9STRA|nr:kinetochore protein NUF2 [Thraustotheca clavata]
MNERKNYSFPIVKMSDLFTYLHEMKINFSEDDIRNCDPAAVRRLMEEFIHILMDMKKEDINQPDLAGLSMLEYPQLYDDSIPEITYYRTVSRLMTVVGIHDFGWNDVHKPTLKRIRRIFSALLNFTRFKEQQMIFLSAHEKQSEEAANLLEQEKEKNRRLKLELERLKMEKEKNAPMIQQAMEECLELESEINVLNKRQAVFRHENAGLKNQNNQLRDDYASVQIAVLEAKKTIEKLRGKIVSSPARFQSDIAKLSDQVERGKDELGLLDQRTTELDKIHDVFSRADKEINKVIELMHETEVDTERVKKEKEKVKMQHQQIEENYNKAKQAATHHSRLLKLMAQRNEQMEQYKQQASSKMQAAQHALATVTAELTEVRSKNKDKEQKIQALRATAQEIKRKTHVEQQEYERQLREMEEVYALMESKVKEYNRGLLQSIPKPAP